MGELNQSQDQDEEPNAACKALSVMYVQPASTEPLLAWQQPVCLVEIPTKEILSSMMPGKATSD